MQNSFETFLKCLFWANSNSKEPNSLLGRQAFFSKTKKRGRQTLQNIISLNFPNINTPSDDIDDLAVKNWNSAITKAKQDLVTSKDKTGSVFDFLNQEINPHAHISKFLHENTQERIAVPWPAKLASVATMALIAAVMITRFAPVLANRMISVGDSIVVEPIITTTYLFGGESALAKINVDVIPQAYQSPKVEQVLDKNVLGSYIVNNHEQYAPDPSGEAIYIISKEELDGRVAGAWETYDSFEPSEELTNISTNKNSRLETLKRAVLNILKKTEEIQIQISEKLETKLINKVREK